MLPNSHNQGYWFVVREDQSNVIFSSNNNFTVQNPQPQCQEQRYIIDTCQPSETRSFIQLNDAPSLTPQVSENTEIDDKKSDNNFWDKNKVKLLLRLCLENNVKNVIKDGALLDEIASHIGTTPGECINKYKNLRRTFIRLLKKRRQGKEVKWIHYNICNKIFNEFKSLPPSVLEPWDDLMTKNLLNLYIDNLSRFRGPGSMQKDVWRDIASQLGTTEYNCYHKFKNLKRAYFKWQQRARETDNPIKWPYHQYFERIFYNYFPSSGQWNRTKTRKLVDAYLQRADKFRNPKYQKKDLWKEISTIVGENAALCDKKFRNLKQTYINLRMRIASGRSITKWLYYRDFEAIYNNTAIWKGTLRPRSERYVEQLLTFYLDNKNKFRDHRIKNKYIWRQLSPKIGLSAEECDKKFRNLKQTYLRLVEKKMMNGKPSGWPYLSYFEKIYDEPQSYRAESSYKSKCADREQSPPSWTPPHEDQYTRLMAAMEESNTIQRERNQILLALLNRK